MSAFARVNKSMYTQDGFVLPKLMYNGKGTDDVDDKEQLVGEMLALPR